MLFAVKYQTHHTALIRLITAVIGQSSPVALIRKYIGQILPDLSVICSLRNKLFPRVFPENDLSYKVFRILLTLLDDFD